MAAGRIESHYSRMDKVVLGMVHLIACHLWPFGYQRRSRLYWWLMANSWEWDEIKTERRWIAEHPHDER